MFVWCDPNITSKMTVLAPLGVPAPPPLGMPPLVPPTNTHNLHLCIPLFPCIAAFIQLHIDVARVFIVVIVAAGSQILLHDLLAEAAVLIPRQTLHDLPRQLSAFRLRLDLLRNSILIFLRDYIDKRLLHDFAADFFQLRRHVPIAFIQSCLSPQHLVWCNGHAALRGDIRYGYGFTRFCGFDAAVIVVRIPGCILADGNHEFRRQHHEEIRHAEGRRVRGGVGTPTIRCIGVDLALERLLMCGGIDDLDAFVFVDGQIQATAERLVDDQTCSIRLAAKCQPQAEYTLGLFRQSVDLLHELPQGGVVAGHLTERGPSPGLTCIGVAVVISVIIVRVAIHSLQGGETIGAAV